MVHSSDTLFIQSFPTHGPIPCSRCFAPGEQILRKGKWQAINDPGAWGSSSPRILVLGFSKGFTQANAFHAGNFDDVPFKGMRPRLSEALRALGLLGESEPVDCRMRDGETVFAFGSLVRCSLARQSRSGALKCTGQVMPLAFREEISEVVTRCGETWLKQLPQSLQLILLLGTTDSYIAGCRKLARSLHPGCYSDINEVSYRTGSVVWTHISHPSPLNGHHGNWLRGGPETKPGLKRLQAIKAVALAGVS